MLWSLTHPSLPHVKFKVTTLEFAYKSEGQVEENIQHSTVIASGIAYTLQQVSVWTVCIMKTSLHSTTERVDADGNGK